MVIIDPSKWRSLADSLEREPSDDDPVEQFDARLFTLLMGCSEAAVTASYVRGWRLDTAGKQC